MGVRRNIYSCLRRNHVYWRCCRRYVPLSLLGLVIAFFVLSSLFDSEQPAATIQGSNGWQSEIGPIDVVYTWVNGSDPVLLKSLHHHKLLLKKKLGIVPGSGESNCNGTNWELLCKRAGNVGVCNLTKCQLEQRNQQGHHHQLFPWSIAVLEGTNISLLQSYDIHQISQARPYRTLDLQRSNATAQHSTALLFASSKQALQLIELKNVTYRNKNYSVTEGYVSATCCRGHCALLKDHIIVQGLSANTSSETHRRLKQIASDNYGIKVFVWPAAGTAIVQMPVWGTPASLNTSVFALKGTHSSVQVSPAYAVWNCAADRDAAAPSVDVDGETVPSRFEDNEELRYSLRAIEANAPWVRHVFIVTNGQIPYWLNLNCPRVSVVTHEDIFLNKSHLPTFSSPSIESHIHRIKGLSRYFIYLNDDVLFGRKVYPSDFYSPSSGQRIFLSWPLPMCNTGCTASWLGDGTCDRACNSSQCDFDGGDCLKTAKHSTGRFSFSSSEAALVRCSGSCRDSWLGDRYCDSACNVFECGYDAGDCKEEAGRPLFRVHISNALAMGTVLIPEGHLSARIMLNGYPKNISEGQYTVASGKQLVHAAVVSRTYHYFTVVFVKNCTGLVSFNLTTADKANKSALHFNSTFDTRTVLPNYTRPAPVTPALLGSLISKLSGKKNISGIFPLDKSLQFWKDGKPSFPLLKKRQKPGEGSTAMKGGRRQPPVGFRQRHLMSFPNDAAGMPGKTSRVKKHTLSEPVSSSFLADIAAAELAPADPYDQGTANLPWEKLGVFNDLTKALDRKAAMGSYTSAAAVKSRHTLSDSLDTFGASLTHVNALFNRKFGYSARKVPAHMPHFIDKTIMERLHETFPVDFDVTSAHKFRQGKDMQFAFSYFYFLQEEKRNASAFDIFDQLDVDKSGELSPGETRSLLLRLHDVPLSDKDILQTREMLTACARNMSSVGTAQSAPSLVNYMSHSAAVFTICGGSPWLVSPARLAALNTTGNCSTASNSSAWPVLTSRLLANCSGIARKLVAKKDASKTNKFEKGDSEDVHFMMIRSNVSKALQQLDEVLQSRKKFLCMNDNLDHRSREALQVKHLLKDFYQTLFPARSQFELPEGQQNRVLYAQRVREWHTDIGLVGNLVLSLFVFPTLLLLLWSVKSELLNWQSATVS
ncbi:N-acetylglucosamine-1-phosphotransferase subunits alpha/beta-like isoform X2 [Sycon ciliatum]|uniref:N-acetylglucosamine-1-phosphotransferase subunits alpha/beta-like isoform X2 n=1 Tax=Sycon ciliatum TaxID=27933 RepID=UPI0031F6C320